MFHSFHGLIWTLQRYRAIPMVHWYQWFDWYQYKMVSFQSFYWWICISLRGLRLRLDLDFSCGLAEYRAIPMVHWYQWFDWYQYKMVSFQSFYWWICISLRALTLFSHVVWLGTGQFQWSIGTNGTIGTNGKAPYSNGSIGEYASH